VAAVTATKSAGTQNGAPVRRVITHRPGLPGGRAVLGGLLMAVAAVGVFLAYRGSEGGAANAVVVAAHDLRPGQKIEADDLRLVAVDLPADTLAAAFSEPEAIIGRVVLGPVTEGELVQRGAVTSDDGSAANEIALTLPRAQIAVGRLKQGERVDVYVTYDDRTTSVVRGVEVVQIGAHGERSVTSDRDVELVVAVDSSEAVAALVHALRTGAVTVVRSTFARELADETLVYEPAQGSRQTSTGGDSTDSDPG
jgi:Flp pilus assembly protein CpaB